MCKFLSVCLKCNSSSETVGFTHYTGGGGGGGGDVLCFLHKNLMIIHFFPFGDR